MTYARPAKRQPPQLAQCAAAILAAEFFAGKNSGRNRCTPSGGIHSRLFRSRSITRRHRFGESSTRIALNMTRVKNAARGSDSASCMTFPHPNVGRIIRIQNLSTSGQAQHPVILNFARPLC